jgi:hypothetical protein
VGANEEKNASIRVSAHVLVQLGEELVTDAEQAILECVKNAYDADSPGCSIKVRTQATGSVLQTGTAKDLLMFNRPADNVSITFRDAKGNVIRGDSKAVFEPITRELQWKGSIVIEDKGDGLDAEKIRESWLVISTSSKRSSQGQKKKTTDKGRTPLGDKGLGRLGSMKLGDILSVESATAPSAPLASATFRWADCEVAGTVDQIPVRMDQDLPNTEKFKGTRVSVLGLRDIDQWGSARRALEITKSLARLVSPFEAKAKFPVTVDVDGHKASLVAVTDALLSRAIAEFKFEWQYTSDNKPVLSCQAKFREKLFRPTGGTKKQQDKVHAVFGDDNGDDFLKWVSAKQLKRLGIFDIKTRPSREWLVELRQKFSWEQMVPTGGLPVIDPGPFSGAFYYFFLTDFSSDDTKEDGAELDVSSAAGLGIDRDMVKEMAGISILRDGFRVRSPGDWLNLSVGMTSGSTYNLRFNNTLGYFSLTGENNFRLVEKSDREGFVDNEAFRGFLAIAETCRNFANESIESIRRAQDTYAGLKLKARMDESPKTPEGSLDVVQEAVEFASSAQQGATTVVDSLREGIDLFESQLVGKTGVAAGKEAVAAFRSALSAAASVQKKLETGRYASTAIQVLRQELGDNRERMLSLYESAAVGLSARGLAHELRTHLVEIRKRTTALEHLIKNGKGTEVAVLPHLRAIRTSCGSISSAASLIDPMLPRTRAVKESIDLLEFIKEYVANRQAGLAACRTFYPQPAAA